ncbi:MAG TPA: glycosyltransferase 87 family protein [Mycobacterium sp.]|nr:glycosyltransferase 87 family protein [Mycobacterium sp.]
MVSIAAQRAASSATASRRVALTTLAAIAVVWAGFAAAIIAGVHGTGTAFLDLYVYRAGGHAVLSGHSLYAPDFDTVNNSPLGLLFTYPPFSALLFVPLAMVPMSVAKVVMTLLTLTTCAVLFAVVLAATVGKWDRLSSWRALTAPMSVRTGKMLFAAALIFIFSTPVIGNFTYGQVNVILYAAVVCDILLPRVWWPRGMLVGLATAVKLTPAAFIGYFLVTRQWRALAVSVVTTAAAVFVSWLVMPSDTVQYFRSTVFDPGRIGGLAFSSNQSLRGAMERLPALDSIARPVWLVATVLILVLAFVAVEASRRCGDTVAAMLSVAIAELLCSPVSWSHHWVWLSAAAIYFLARWAMSDDSRTLAAGTALATIAIAAPWIFLPHSHSRERLWNPIEHVLGGVWAVAGVTLLVWFATAPVRRARAQVAAA